MLDYKLQIIGYYTSADQNMAEETDRIEEAKELATLLGRTFSTINTSIIKDQQFIEALSSNTVFIFNDEQRNLYAYYPIKGIARLSNVVYDKSCIHPAPLEVKNRFIPGSILTIRHAHDDNPKNKGNNHKEKRMRVVRISGDMETYAMSEVRLSNIRKDILVHFGKKTLPLAISEEDRISFSLLYKILGHPWFYLSEYELDCGDCDGYDYSNCDMSRCKNNCEHCGGRKHICNLSCFKYRYDYALSLEHNDSYQKEIEKVKPYLNSIWTPFNSNWESVYEDHKDIIETVRRWCGYLYYTGSTPEDAQEFLDYCEQTETLCDGRRAYKNNIPTIKIVIRSNVSSVVKLFSRYAVKGRTTQGGFLWLFKTGGNFQFKGYDAISDSLGYISFSVKSSEQYPNYVEKVLNYEVSEIVLDASKGEDKYELISLS